MPSYCSGFADILNGREGTRQNFFYVGRREAQGGRFYLIFLSPSLCLTGNLLVFHQIKIALKVKSLPEIAGIGERQRWIYNCKNYKCSIVSPQAAVVDVELKVL